MTLSLLQVSPKVRSMIILSPRDDHDFDQVFCVTDTVVEASWDRGSIAWEISCRAGVSRPPCRRGAVTVCSQCFGEGRPQLLVLLL